jgi:hypothetical protein
MWSIVGSADGSFYFDDQPNMLLRAPADEPDRFHNF